MDCTYNYYLNGQRVIEEHDGSDNLLKQHVWGLGYVDEAVQTAINSDPTNSSHQSCDQTYWLCQDANYNVLGLVDSTGTLRERYEYSAYGQRQVFTSAGSNDPGCYSPTTMSTRVVTSGSVVEPYGINEVGHQGLMHDEECGLVYDRNNYVQPALGRFISPDKLWPKDGLDWFDYVRSNPITRRDPMGLDSIDSGPWNPPAGSPTIGAGNKWDSGWIPDPSGGKFRTTIYYGPWKARQQWIDGCKTKCAAKKQGFRGAIWVADIKTDWQGEIMGDPAKAGTRIAIVQCCCDCPSLSPDDNKKQREKWDAGRDKFRKGWSDDMGPWPKDQNGNPWPGHHIDDLKHGGDPLGKDNVLPVPPDAHKDLNAAYIDCYKDGGGWDKAGPDYPYKE